MNYIQKLQRENEELRKRSVLASELLVNFNTFLHSEKFTGNENGERKDWIATGDVIAWIREARREIEV